MTAIRDAPLSDSKILCLDPAKSEMTPEYLLVSIYVNLFCWLNSKLFM